MSAAAPKASRRASRHAAPRVSRAALVKKYCPVGSASTVPAVEVVNTSSGVLPTHASGRHRTDRMPRVASSRAGRVTLAGPGSSVRRNHVHLIVYTSSAMSVTVLACQDAPMPSPRPPNAAALRAIVSASPFDVATAAACSVSSKSRAMLIAWVMTATPVNVVGALHVWARGLNAAIATSAPQSPLLLPPLPPPLPPPSFGVRVDVLADSVAASTGCSGNLCPAASMPRASRRASSLRFVWCRVSMGVGSGSLHTQPRDRYTCPTGMTAFTFAIAT